MQSPRKALEKLMINQWTGWPGSWKGRAKMSVCWEARRGKLPLTSLGQEEEGWHTHGGREGAAASHWVAETHSKITSSPLWGSGEHSGEKKPHLLSGSSYISDRYLEPGKQPSLKQQPAPSDKEASPAAREGNYLQILMTFPTPWSIFNNSKKRLH